MVADLAHLAAQPKQRSHPGAEKSVRLAVSMLVKTVLQVGGWAQGQRPCSPSALACSPSALACMLVEAVLQAGGLEGSLPGGEPAWSRESGSRAGQVAGLLRARHCAPTPSAATPLPLLHPAPCLPLSAWGWCSRTARELGRPLKRPPPPSAHPPAPHPQYVEVVQQDRDFYALWEAVLRALQARALPWWPAGRSGSGCLACTCSAV